VAGAAEAAGLPLLEVAGVKAGEGFAALDALEPDALVVVAYGEILTPDVLDIPVLGAVNVHFSLLPRWRGAAPVQRAILEGDTTTGVTVMLMDEGMDTGPILATVQTAIAPDEDAGSLGARLAELGAPLLVDTLRRLDEGSAEPRSQDAAATTYAPKLLPEEREIDWTQPAGAIVRRVRALAPDPGAVTTFRGGRLKVLTADVVPVEGGVVPVAPIPGRPAVDEEGSPIVDSSRDLVRLLEVAPAGRKRMNAADWARGARLQPDERLG
jgi:methionyl-tRNA formyltransferase